MPSTTRYVDIENGSGVAIDTSNYQIFVMGKGAKPGDTPTMGTNLYYDVPTNPLIVCNDTFTSQSTICMEIRTDNITAKYGAIYDNGIRVDNSGGYSSGTTINTDAYDPRDRLTINDTIYKSDGTYLGKVSALARRTGSSKDGTITLSSTIASSISDNDALYSSTGVSNSQTYNILNRIYPNDSATSALYLENLENTPGYRIRANDSVGNGQSLSAINLDNNDYFVMINPDNPKTHHFARITAVTNQDIAADSFEFSPKYGSEIAKGTKFTIWKGPETSDTAVVAVSYGLYGSELEYAADDDDSDGTGGATDSRHSGLTYLAEPLFYFYEDRLKKKGQLDHNTKYSLRYSRSDDGSEYHYTRTFLTCSDYGMKIVDYGPFNMNATMVDKLKEYDEIDSSNHTNDATWNTLNTNVDVNIGDWNQCFINNRRNTENLNYIYFYEGSSSKYYPEGSLTGPTKYLHYDTSPSRNNLIPEVLELQVFDSINETGSYADLRIGDPNRIYGRKINKYDALKIRKQVAIGSLTNDYKGELPGTWSGAGGLTTFNVQLEEGQDLRVLLKNVTASGTTYELIKIGDYVYRITDIGDVNTSLTQSVEIDEHRLAGTQYVFDGSGAGVAIETLNATAYRKPWSKICQNLIVDFPIDTKVTYHNIGTSNQSETITYGSITKTSGAGESPAPSNIAKETNTRLYDSELVIMGGQENGLEFKVNYGDSYHNIISLQNTRLQMYRDEADDEGNFLDYFNGEYIIYKTIFEGKVETLQDYVEDGMLKYHIAGRNKTSELFGPILNKDFKHTEDIIYSTYGPLLDVEDTSADSSSTIGTWLYESTNISVDGTVSNIANADLLFNGRGALIGSVDSGGGTSVPSILNGNKVGVKNNDDIWKLKSGTNRITFGKALEANPNLNTSPTSFRGTSNKGLIFTSGKKLITDSYGNPTTEISKLLGTSANSNNHALGYYINNPLGISTDFDLPFSLTLQDETPNTDGTIGTTKKEIHTVNSLTEYDIIDVDTGEGKSVITVAPNCPVVMGRIDENPADSNHGTLTKSLMRIKNSGTTSKGHFGVISLDDLSAGGTDYSNAIGLLNKHLYNSTGIHLGKCIEIRDNGVIDVNGSATCRILLDRPLPIDLNFGDYFYTLENPKSQGLYLINTQGLRTGGFIQLLDSRLDEAYKPIPFNTIQTADGVWTEDSSNRFYCAVNRYGPYNWRYMGLQKGTRGALNYSKWLTTGDISSYYSDKTSQYCGYATVFRVANGVLTNPIITEPETDNDYTDNYKKFGSHETRGIYPAQGSNFADYDKYSSGATNTDYTLMPQKNDASKGGPFNIDKLGSTYASGTGLENVAGLRSNAVKTCRDAFEIIDPKVTRNFLFSTSDLYPDSMTRTNHIGNVERDFVDYNIMLKSEPSQVKSSISHYKYAGKLNNLQLSDDSYETAIINSSTIKTNQMKRMGIMRLTEMTLDWHFNEIDPEQAPEFQKNNIPYFKYSRYQKLKLNALDVTGIATDSVTNDKMTLSGPPAANGWAVGDYVYYQDGSFLGIIKSLNASPDYMICKDSLGNNVAWNKVGGAHPTSGDLYQIDKGAANNSAYYNYFISGRNGDDSFSNFSAESAKRGTSSNKNWYSTPRDLNMLQAAVFNGYGSTEENSLGSTDAEGYGFDSDTAFKKYFLRKMDFSVQSSFNGWLNHITLPPVLEGYTIEKLFKSGGSGTRTWVYRSGGADYTSGTTFQVNGITRASGSLTAGDRIYTENGEFVGTYVNNDGATYPTITIAENINTTIGKLYADNSHSANDDGTILCLGGNKLTSSTDSAEIEYDGKAKALGCQNGGGGHALSPKEIIPSFADGQTSSTIPTQEFIHPSRVLESIGNFILDTSKPNPYAQMRAVFLSRHGIEGSGDNDNGKPQAAAGMSTKTIGTEGNSTDFTEAQQKQKALNIKIGSKKNESVKDYAPAVIGLRLEDTSDAVESTGTKRYRGEFGKFKIKKDDDGEVSRNRGKDNGEKTICDGVELVLKPLFNTENATKSGVTELGKSIRKIRINPATDTKMGWISFAPNLTGCYLVSTESRHFLNNNMGVNSDNAFTSPIQDHIPKQICYIMSHEIIRTGSTIFHDFMIDNMNSSTTANNYRIMRPNQVCFWPESDHSNVDLYVMDKGNTKYPRRKEMYKGIPLFRYFEDGWKTWDLGESDYGESIQSMYVIVNTDHTSTESYLVPRDTSHTHHSKLFGDGKTFEDRETYDMYLNDGVSQQRQSMKVYEFNGRYTKLEFSEPFNSTYAGVVSLGEVFTLETATPISLKNPKTASIGTTVAVGLESEQIINDILEENDITYTTSTITYPYFTAPNIQGADLYNSAKLLAGFKDKELVIDKKELKLISKNDSSRYTNIVINQDNTDIKVMEISKSDSGFDEYNEIIVYGRGVKAVKRNMESIREVGKKTYEEFDTNLDNQADVDKRAISLMNFYNDNKERITIKLINKNVEWIKSGDIITIDYPDEHIRRNHYMVYEIRHTTLGTLEIEAGAYDKSLDSRLAEIIVQNKKIASYLRSDRFKSSAVDTNFFEKFKIKPIKLIARKTTVAGHTALGLSTTLGFATLLRAGTRTTTEILDEDLI